MANLEWTVRAVSDLEKLDNQIARRIVRKIGWIGKNFEKIIPEPLHGNSKGLYKTRIGDWRAIYTIEIGTITIHYIAHRKDVYRI